MSDLLERAQRGEAGAFDRLYREHVDRVYAICLRLSADPGMAERLTQDVFIRAWRRLGSFRGESRLSTWLYRIAVNVFLEERRSRSRRDRWVEDAGPGGTEAYAAAIEHGAADTRLDLERAIASLPTGARTAVVLHDVEGFRYEEIAALTGVALGTVKSQIHRGRRLLREALG